MFAVASNGHIMTRNEPTIVCGGNICPFLAKLVTYNRCVVTFNHVFEPIFMSNMVFAIAMHFTL